ncbi:hypothetical protein HW561_21210 [Rhodobacteraceae bacterium B1Z28]|uniref:Autotransporter domain-containing protein n=1 Tax=Ruegeria haliotis TaxID=2747601 RepID=A0ABX2PW97_9RHOB|nr:hypothetical protein [Ruegeria haliotis]NVO58308.1 hypothetical protein [Ruegeria haliotis]
MTKIERSTRRPQDQDVLVRGGRMTKHKGQVASFAPSLGRVLSGVSAAALGTAITLGSSTATAGSCAGLIAGSGNLLCSGPADPVNDISVGIISIAPVDVETAPGFGIEPFNAHNAIDIFSSTQLTFTDTNQSSITGKSDGLRAVVYNGGDVSVTTTGVVTGGNFGIYARNYGTFSTSGDMTISAADVTSGSSDGIFARNNGADLTITTSGVISGARRGIEARNTGTGALSISTANVNGAGGVGISATNNGTNLSITTTGTVSGGSNGINATNYGTGALTISAADTTGTTRQGIRATNYGTDLSITASGVVTGAREGIYAGNHGSGNLTLTVEDAVSTTDGFGINARNFGAGDLTLSANNATGIGDYAGIYASNTGNNLSITTTGAVNGDRRGILTTNRGSGTLNISVHDVAGTRFEGISAHGFGTDLSISSSGSVSGQTRGIYTQNFGIGSQTISASNVTGVTGDGIDARNFADSTNLSIRTSGMVSGAARGIYARNAGSGITSVAVSGAVSGGTGAGIDTQTNAGGLSVITLNSGASVSATSGEAITNNEGNSQVILAAGSAVAGAVRLNDGADALTINGGADISGATLFDGGAGTQDQLTLSAFSGAIDGTRFTNWETTVADNGSALTITGTAADFGVLTAQNGSSIAAGDANLALGGALQIDATNSFSAGFGGTGAVSIGGDTLSNGLVRLDDGQSGDRLTFGGNLSGAGTVALDVNFTTGANDQIFVTGDSAGAQQGLQVEKAGNGSGRVQNFTLATVTGTSTASDFRLVDGDFVTKNGQDAINEGSVAYVLNYDAATGEFILSPFNADGEVNTNPDRAFLAASVQQFSDQIALGGALRRLSGRTGSSDTNTVSRSLIDLSTTNQPLFWLEAEGGRDHYTNGDRTNETSGGGLRVGASLPIAELGNGSLIGGLEFGATTLSTNSETSLASGTG